MKRKSSKRSRNEDSSNGTEEYSAKPKNSREESGNESEGSAGEDESQYEVESVLDVKSIKGVRHYLIRWKGYTEESDTWEPASTLDCDELIKDFKTKKTKKDKKKSKKEHSTHKDTNDENGDYEVDRIVDVHFKRDGKREFLVHWKGYANTENTWEPEENMDCQDLIERFMAKLEKVKEVDSRELRPVRKPVQRLTLMMADGGRRLSKRIGGKERAHYYDAE